MRITYWLGLVGWLVLLGCEGEPPVEQGPALLDLRPYADLGGAFELLDQQGEAFALADLGGRAALLFFGYTFCPDFCPTTLSRLGRVHELVEDDSLATIFISVDAERDTPEVLREYLAYFPLETIALTGSRAALDRVVELYGAEYEIEQRDRDGHYLVNHSTDVYLLDGRGLVRYLFDYDVEPEAMAEVIRALRQEQEVVELRRAEDDPLLAVRDLGRVGCGSLRPEQPEEFNFWNVGNPRPGTAESGAKGEQPAYEYDLGSRKAK